MAVRPPDEVLDAVAEAVATGQPVVDGLRWAGREQWHLTLQFLGPLARLAPVVAALSLAAGERAASRCSV